MLLLILIWAAGHTWLDRIGSTRWQQTLWVGVFPINAEGTASVQHYLDTLSGQDFSDVESFLRREAHRYGRTLDRPVHIALYPQVRQLPPELNRSAGMLATIAWSLRVRWYAFRAASLGGQAPPRIRLFVLYHDPAALRTAPDSHGLQKGLIGIVHAFATPAMAGMNAIVLAHELLHTLGASDKYDLRSGFPLYPDGFAEPDRIPPYPQLQAEIMAAVRPLSATQFQMPASLDDVVVGPRTAAEIRWIHSR